MIHQYKLGGYNIVLDVCSGAVHAVDEIAYDIIALYEQNDKESVLEEIGSRYPTVDGAEIEECYDQITELKDMGKLFAPDTFQPLAGTLKE